MSIAFGSTDTLADCSLSERLAARLLSMWLPVFDRFVGNSLRFDRDHLRLGLHGESEYAGVGYRRGMLAMATVVMNVFLSAVPGFVLHYTPVPASLVGSLLFIAAILASLGFFLVTAVGSLGLADRLEFVDHTVPEQPRAELAAAREAFVDGDLDEDEFGARVEEVLER